MSVLTSLLAALMCGVGGMMAAAALNKRQALLTAWLHSLRRIETTLKSQRLPIDKVLQSGLGEHPLIDTRLGAAIDALAASPATSLEAAFAGAMESSKASYEHQQERDILASVFADIGSGTLEKRQSALALGLEKLDAVNEKAIAACDKNCRLYRSLGWLGGLALMLLLL